MDGDKSKGPKKKVYRALLLLGNSEVRSNLGSTDILLRGEL